MNPKRLTPEEVRYERAKTERAQYIIAKAIEDKKFMQETLEAYETSEHDEGVSFEQVCEEYGI